jgi:hypothetical protein
MKGVNMETKKKTTILGIIATVVAVIALYITGKMLDINVAEQFAPYVATILIGWVLYAAQKWFGVKLDFLNNEFTKQKTVEAIIWAEGKAIEKFKLDDVITEGKKKAQWAAAQVVGSLPNIDEERASELIAYYFPQVRPVAEKMWHELADEIKSKSALKE